MIPSKYFQKLPVFRISFFILPLGTVKRMYFSEFRSLFLQERKQKSYLFFRNLCTFPDSHRTPPYSQESRNSTFFPYTHSCLDFYGFSFCKLDILSNEESTTTDGLESTAFIVAGFTCSEIPEISFPVICVFPAHPVVEAKRAMMKNIAMVFKFFFINNTFKVFFVSNRLI